MGSTQHTLTPLQEEDSDDSDDEDSSDDDEAKPKAKPKPKSKFTLKKSRQISGERLRTYMDFTYRPPTEKRDNYKAMLEWVDEQVSFG